MPGVPDVVAMIGGHGYESCPVLSVSAEAEELLLLHAAGDLPGPSLHEPEKNRECRALLAALAEGGYEVTRGRD